MRALVTVLVPDHDEARALADAAPRVALCVLPEDGVRGGRIEDVEFCVPPWWLLGELAARLPRMPRLRVIQTLSSGVEWVLLAAPPGVTVCNDPRRARRAGRRVGGPARTWPGSAS